jgi:hypothetical protein
MPTAGDQHVNGLLTNVAVSWYQKAKNFVAAECFPVVPVKKQSDRYVVYDKGDLLRDEAAERAPATESAGMDYDIDTSPTYFAPKYALHKDVDDDSRENADKPMNPDRDAVKILMQKMLIKRERIWANSYIKSGVWTNDYTGVASGPTTNQFVKWSVSGSKPVKNVETWKNVIEEITGLTPNVLVLTPDVVVELKDNADILGRIQYTQRGIITPDILASLFDVEKVLVPRGIYETAAKGATSAPARIAGSGKALLCYATNAPSIDEPSAGYFFAWEGLFGASAFGGRIKKFRMEERSADRVEAEMAFDAKQVAPDLGLFASSVI